MSEKKKAQLQIIQGEKEEISDAEFEMFLKALIGPYTGGKFQQE